MRIARRWWLVVLAALALSGCTYIAPARNPGVIAKRDVPFGLLRPYIPGTNHARVRFVTQPIYLLDAGYHLVPSSRIVPTPIRLSTVVDQLLSGPSVIERSAGYTSALPANLVLVSAKIVHHVGVINLGNHLSRLPLTQQIRAEGQLVMTADAAGATRGLIIEVADVRQSMPIPGGGHSRFLTTSQFQGLLNN